MILSIFTNLKSLKFKKIRSIVKNKKCETGKIIFYKNETNIISTIDLSLNHGGKRDKIVFFYYMSCLKA